MKENHQPITHQSGHVLLVSLTVSLGISLLGAVAMQSGQLEVRMASTWRDRDQEFQQLELALRHVERHRLNHIDPAETGPWESIVDPVELTRDLVHAGSPHSISATIAREPMPAPLLRGRGINPQSNHSNSQRYRITVTTLRNDGREALSLQGISGYLTGVSP